jgi:hypothetical protein
VTHDENGSFVRFDFIKHSLRQVLSRPPEASGIPRGLVGDFKLSIAAADGEAAQGFLPF